MLKHSYAQGLRGHVRTAGRKLPARRLIGIGLAVLTAGVVLSVNVPTVGATVAAYYHQYQITRPAYEAKYGLWVKLNIPAKFRVNGIHSTLLNNGDVLIMAGSGNNQSYFDAGTFKTLLLDPVTMHEQLIPTPWDLFCAGHIELPRAQLMMFSSLATRKGDFSFGVIPIEDLVCARCMRIRLKVQL